MKLLTPTGLRALEGIFIPKQSKVKALSLLKGSPRGIDLFT